MSENDKPDTLCLIYADRVWDITPSNRVIDEIAEFQKALKEGRRGSTDFRSIALNHLRAMRPDCIRLKSHTELTGTLERFKSYRRAGTEARYIETVFARLDVTKVRYIRVYTRPSNGERGLYKHCDLNLAVSVTIF